MVAYRNGEMIDSGAGAAVLGNPLRSVAWLANSLGKYDVALKAGEIVLSGALTSAIEVRTMTHLQLNLLILVQSLLPLNDKIETR